ncbi:MAG TPA: STAS domain-containing protein [Pyrinomonadaceae bacterium]|nr:STAS domain-containing protein [Pyrinomonadaceae bacterium]
MPTQITQIDDQERKILRVEGSLTLEDAELLERICAGLRQQGDRITLDLADLSFLDTESASVLCRLKRQQGVSLEGVHQFVQKMIELVERTDAA